MIYVVFETDTRRPVSIGSTEPRDVREPLAVYLLPEPYETLGQYVWAPETLTLVPRPPVVVTTMSKLTFASRWSLPEQVALDMAMEAHPDPEVRATIRVVQRTMDRATEVSVLDPRTVQGTDVLLDVLVGAGVLTPETRVTRRAAILAPLSPEEMTEGGGP